MGTARATEVEIGDPTAATGNYYLPFYTLYNYGISQQIYTAEEIGMAGTINSLTLWLYNGGTNVLPTMNISIYMKEVDRAAFASTSDWEALTADDLVYTSNSLVVTNTVAQEYEFTLDNPFTYSGTSNLLIAIFNNTGSYKSGLYSLVFTATGQAMSTQRDASAYDITAPGVAGTSRAFKNVITLDITGGEGPTCDKPATIEVTDVTGTSATINWSGETSAYTMEYKPTSAGDDAWQHPVVASNTTSYTLTGLTPETAYSVRVYGVCGDEVSGAKSTSFTTAIELPYIVDFDELTAIPSKWGRYSGAFDPATGTATRTSSSSAWSFVSSTTGVFESKHVYCTIGYTYKYWLQTPALPIGETTQLSFTMALSASTTAHTAVTPGAQPDKKFFVLASVDDGATWAILRQWDNDSSAYVYDEISVDGEEVVLDLSDYADQNVLLAFYGHSTTSNKYTYLHIDDIRVGAAPTCLKPTELHEVEGMATTSSVQLAWTANNEEVDWLVQYKKKSETEWQTTYAVSNPFTLRGLEAYTEYNVRVAASCNATDESDYTKPILVKTATGVPFHQGFSGTLPSDWKRYSGILEEVQSGGELEVVTTGWNSVTKANGNNIFPDSARHLMLNVADTCSYWVVSPTIEMAANQQLTFDLALTGENGGTVTPGAQQGESFAVLVYNGTWTALRTWKSEGSGYLFDEISGSANGEKVTLDLTAYADQNILIAFYGESTNGEDASNNLHISNLLIDAIPACSPASSLSIDAIDVTTATANWTAEAAGTWQYGYVANPDTNFVITDASFTYETEAMTAALEGLTANTPYVFFLRKTCGEANSDILIRKFSTFPAPKSVPWDETFESMDASTVPAEWDNSASGTTTVTGANPHYVWGVYEYEGNKMIRMYNYFVSSGTAIINTPRIVLPSEVVSQLSFNYAHTATCGKFSVKISNDNGATWTQLGEYDKTSTGTDKDNPGQFETIEINLPTYIGQTVMLQFFANANYGSGAIFVDNVRIHEAPACERPTGLNLSELHAESAVFAWDEVSNGAWEYAVAPADAAEPEEFTPIAVNSVNVENLTEKTAYKFYLRQVCGEAYSENYELSFTTIANPVAVPWSENFESMEADTIPEGWDNSASGTSTLTSYPERVWGVYEYEGNKMIRMYNYFVSSGTALINTPRFALPESPAYVLSFDYAHTATCGNFSIKVSEDNGDTWTTFPTSYGKTSTGTDKDNPGQFTTAEISLADYAGKTIMLQFFASANYGSGAIFVDNVNIYEAPTCMKPIELAVIDSLITTNSATITWTPQTAEQYWLVQYKKSTDEEWTYVPDSVSNDTLVLSGLEPASVYDVRVAAWCNTADTLTEVSDYSTSISFETKCVAITEFPYSEGFDSIAGATSGHVLPICWNYINTSTSTYYDYYPTVYASSTVANTPNNSLKFYAYYTAEDQYAILPEMEGLSGLRIKFNARKYSTSYDATFTVGIMTDPADTATYVVIDTVSPAADSYEPFVIPFDSYNGTGKYIAIKVEAPASSYRGTYIDDIVVEEIPNCLEPVGLAVLDSTITTTSAEVTWTSQGTETAWVLQYKKHADEEWLSVTALTDTILLEGLDPATKYDVQVAATFMIKQIKEMIN